MPHESAKPIMQDLGDQKSFICRAFASLAPPQGPVDHDDGWTHVYRDIASLSLNRVQGELSLTHKPDGSLRIENYRNCPQGYRSYTLATLQCGDDVLATPSKWHVESKVAKSADDPAYLKSGLKKEFSVKGGILTQITAGKKRTVKLPGLYTCKWCLLDAVGRMARETTKEISFTLLDEYDEPCPDQEITLRGKSKVKTKSGTIDVISYQHTGKGTMPGVFYADTAGRVLAYLAGMQLLLLDKVTT